MKILATIGLPEPGARIRLLEMPDDPCPIPVGDEGTVSAVHNPGTSHCQIAVRWDSGRTLMLVPGVDRYEVLA